MNQSKVSVLLLLVISYIFLLTLVFIIKINYQTPQKSVVSNVPNMCIYHTNTCYYK